LTDAAAAERRFVAVGSRGSGSSGDSTSSSTHEQLRLRRQASDAYTKQPGCCDTSGGRRRGVERRVGFHHHFASTTF
jgi:hypothetical protein